MTYQPTTKQKEAATERRRVFQMLLQDLATLSVEQRLSISAGISTVEAHALSLTNACLVAFQCPKATIVGGFRQWIAAGRCVKKGEHGLSIWIPGSRKTTETGTSSTRPDETPHFFMGVVFDISQTEAVHAKES